MSACLVTGSSGFVGSHLARRLLAAHQTVRGLDLHPPDAALTALGLEHTTGDTRDPAVLDRIVPGCEVIYHLASMVLVGASNGLFREINVAGTRAVLDAARKHGVRKVLFMSSSSVYGNADGVPLSEDTPLAPFDAYGASKAEAEAACGEARASGLDVSIVRPPPILGPGRMGIMKLLFDWLHRGHNFYILGAGGNRLQLVSVDDLVELCRLVATRECTGEDFNVGCESYGTLRSDLEELARHASPRSRIVSLPARPARALLKGLSALKLAPVVDYHYHLLTRDHVLDTRKANRVLNWRATESNSGVLKRTFDWYVSGGKQEAAEAASPHRRGVSEGILAVLRWFS